MQTVVGIFAHPDDEAFGPGGTLAKFAKQADVYLICVTNGDAKQKNKALQKHIGETRKKELLQSAKILEIKKVFFLNYHDGSLCHNLYHEIAEKVKQRLERLQPDILVTFEPRGVSGHIDHIVVSMVVSFLFPTLPYAKKLLYYCNDEAFRALVKEYFIHFPPGYKLTEIDQVINTESVWNVKISAMQQHRSQIEDMKKVLGWQSQRPKEEYFLLIEKK